MAGRSNTLSWIPPRVEKVLAYVFGIVSGCFIALFERRDRDVRVHGVQSIVLALSFAPLLVLAVFLDWALPIFGNIFHIATSVGYVVLSVIAAWLAWKHHGDPGKDNADLLPLLGQVALGLTPDLSPENEGYEAIPSEEPIPHDDLVAHDDLA